MAHHSGKKHKLLRGNPPVSFEVFSEYIKNRDEIVLKILEKMYGKKRQNFHELLQCKPVYNRILRVFYKAFYSAPEIREHYKIQFKSCSVALRLKLLSIPTPLPKRSKMDEITHAHEAHEAEAHEAETEVSNNNEGNSPAINLPYRSKYIQNDEFQPPVTFEFFCEHILNRDEIIEQILKKSSNYNENQIQNILKDRNICNKIFRAFYLGFYLHPKIRNSFEFKLKPSPKLIKDQILQIVNPSETPQTKDPLRLDSIRASQASESSTELINVAKIETLLSEEQDPNIQSNQIYNSRSEQDERNSSQSRLTFKEFLRSIGNRKEVAHRILKEIYGNDHEDMHMMSMNESVCEIALQAYYRKFCEDPETRAAFSLRQKACPKDLLLSICNEKNNENTSESLFTSDPETRAAFSLRQKACPKDLLLSICNEKNNENTSEEGNSSITGPSAITSNAQASAGLTLSQMIENGFSQEFRTVMEELHAEISSKTVCPKKYAIFLNYKIRTNRWSLNIIEEFISLLKAIIDSENSSLIEILE